MDQVANILKGILSNLSKHKTLVQVGKEVAKAREEDLSKLSASDQKEVLSLLRVQLTNLGKDDATIKGLIGDDVNTHKSIRQALVATVWHLAPTAATFRSAANITGSGFVLFTEPECNYSAHAETKVKTMKNATKIVNASAMFLDGFVDRAPELYYFPEADSQPRRFEGSFDNTTAVAEFYNSTAAGVIEARDTRVLAQVKTGERGFTDVSSKELMERMLKEKDVFVVFYSPMCGHCQNFVIKENSPLDQIGAQVESLGASQTLDVVSVDVSKQTFIPTLFPTIQYVPAMFMVPGDHKTAVPYSGSHDVQVVMSFLEENAVHAKDALSA